MPRLGLGSVDLSALGGTGQDVVTTIDDFVFESFTSGEMHPMLTTSRTNIITYSEDFSQWTRTGNTAISATNVISPTGATNATTIIGLNGGGGGGNDLRFFPNSFNSANKTLTFSVHLKGSGTLRIQMSNGVDQGVQEVVTLTSDWKRHTLTGAFNSTTTPNTFHVNIDDSTATATTYDVWGAQLEEDGFVSNYIPTTGSATTVSTTLNDTSEVWDFDSTDIMLEADPEDEGFWEEGSNLVLNHDYEELSSELVTNEDFENNVIGWNKFKSNATESWNAGGYLDFTKTGVSGRLGSDVSLETNKTYKISVNVISLGGILDLYVGLSDFESPFTGVNSTPLVVGTNTFYLTYPGSASSKGVYLQSAGTNYFGLTASIDNVSVKQVDPNDRWTLGTGWSIEDGKLIIDGTNTGFQSAQQNNVTVVGDTYEATVTVEATSGAVELKGSGVYTRIDTLGVGTHTFTFVADSTNIRFTAAASATITLDNFTVREYAITPLDV